MNIKIKSVGLKTSGLLHGADYNYEQWLDYPEILDADFHLMKEAGCNVMTIGVFSWSLIETEEGVFDFSWMDRLFDRLEENGILAILATPSGAKPAWLSESYPETCRVGRDGRREPHGQRHNHCRTSPIYREKTSIINTKLAERYGRRKNLLLWHVSNEYNAGECHCELCINAFQEWLKKHYVNLDKLNKAWWTTFWSHRYTSWTQIRPTDKSIHGLNLDWMRFISDQTLDFYLSEAAVLRAITPEIPITTNFMVPNVGLNYWDFAEKVDVISWDSYPRWHLGEEEWLEGVRTSFFHDMHRSYKNAPFLLMESTPSATNWQGISIPKRPNMHLLSSLQAVAHGSNTVQYFQWRQSRGGEEKFHGAVISHSGDNTTQVFRNVAAVGNRLQNLTALAETRVEAQVAIVYDLESEWALDLAQLPRSEDKAYQERCIAHYRAFWRLAVSCDVIDSVASDFSRYKLIIAPMLYMFRDGVTEKLKKFVARGGTLVLSYLTGMVDSSDLCFLGGFPGNLQELTGLTVEETDVLHDPLKQKIVVNWDENTETEYNIYHYADRIIPHTARTLGHYTLGHMANGPAVTRNRYGKGSAWYLGPRIEDSFFDDFYKKLIPELGIEQNIRGELSRGVTCQKRSSGNRDYLFIMNFNGTPGTVHSGDTSYIDMHDGSAVKGEINLPAYGIRILERR